MPDDSEMSDIVLVSGGASGIGRAIAEHFIRIGSSVHICDASANHIDDFLEANPAASATQMDVSDAEQVDRLFDELEKLHNGLDILVNNAGIAGPVATVEAISIDDWNRCIDVDLNGFFYLTRRAVPILKKASSGSIINIASSAGLFGCPSRSPYVASKWAMVGLTKTWAMELGPDNIRVNAICPGSVAGERIDAVIERDAAERGLTEKEIRGVYLRQSSMRKFASTDDIANMVLFLASENAKHISGQIIAVDGHTEGLSNWLD